MRLMIFQGSLLLTNQRGLYIFTETGWSFKRMDQNLPMTGNLSEVYLSEILKQLQSIRATGALALE